jgi:hypothetical protein
MAEDTEDMGAEVEIEGEAEAGRERELHCALLIQTKSNAW